MTELACHPRYTFDAPPVQTRGAAQDGAGRGRRTGPGRALGREFQGAVISGGIALAVLSGPVPATAESPAEALSEIPAEVLMRIDGAKSADAAEEPGRVWTGLLETCLAMMDRRVLVPSLGKHWRPKGFGERIGETERLRDYVHRPTQALARLRHDREARRVSFCGTSIFRTFPASSVRAATEDWAKAETEAGRLTDTGREEGLGRKLEPVADMVWTYRWCGPNGGAASIRLEMSEFPPARMDIYRIDACAEEG